MKRRDNRVGPLKAHEIFGQPYQKSKLSAADTTPFVNRDSVIENTTELLEPVPRKTKRDSF